MCHLFPALSAGIFALIDNFREERVHFSQNGSEDYKVSGIYLSFRAFRTAIMICYEQINGFFRQNSKKIVGGEMTLVFRKCDPNAKPCKNIRI